MKTVLLIPGFQEDLTNTRDYGKTIRGIESKGYAVVFVPINWKHTTITDWVAEFEATYQQYDPKTTVLAGFSFGSVTALVAAAKRLPSELWLFSLSPYFTEDFPNLKPSWLRPIGKHRSDAFRKLSFDSLAPLITCPTRIFYGEAEGKRYQVIKTRAELAHRQLANSHLSVAPKAWHDVADNSYVTTIIEAI